VRRWHPCRRWRRRSSCGRQCYPCWCGGRARRRRAFRPSWWRPSRRKRCFRCLCRGRGRLAAPAPQLPKAAKPRSAELFAVAEGGGGGQFCGARAAAGGCGHTAGGGSVAGGGGGCCSTAPVSTLAATAKPSKAVLLMWVRRAKTSAAPVRPVMVAVEPRPAMLWLPVGGASKPSGRGSASVAPFPPLAAEIRLRPAVLSLKVVGEA